MQDNKHSSPDSSEDMKYLFTSWGALSGCLFDNRFLKPCSNEPSENATFAKRAIETGVWIASRFINNSIIRLLAPIILTGFEALSVDTQKYFFDPFVSLIVFMLFNMFVFIIRTNVNGLLSLRTCFKAEKFKT